MLKLFLDGWSLVAPGLPGREASRGILTGTHPYRAEPLATFSPTILPMNERRRITPTIRLALQVALDALDDLQNNRESLQTVFVSSGGDLEIVDRVCSALTRPGNPVSPTDFHNSVHNAPAGYWAIGTQCRAPSSSLSAGTFSFAAGLLESATQSCCEDRPVLFVCYELPPPAPLASLWPVGQPLALAFLLQPRRSPSSHGELTLRIVPRDEPVTALDNPELRALACNNQAALGLPLLELIAKASTGRCRLGYLAEHDLLVDFAPC